MSSLAHLFVLVIYQPFFNILVFFYYLLDKLMSGNADMGIAVIFLTILIRILLLPMSMAGEKSEAERREIAKQVKGLETVFAQDPIALRQHKRQLLQRNRWVIVAELFSLAVQIAISLMLWRIFARGLEGEDFHLLYPFMPTVETPFNLVFLGRYDLAHTSFFLNLVQSLLIFAVETVSIYTSPYPPEKGEVVRLQLILPVVSFFAFMFLPAGKKLFVITTLTISLILVIYRHVRRRFEAYKLDQEAKELALAEALHPEEKIVVEVK